MAESPASAPAREALENLANILDNWQPLITLYEKALSAKGKERLAPDLERELLLVVAVAYDEKLAQSDRAVEYFRRAQSIQPEDASALVALERLYTRTERWSDLVDTLLKKAQLVTDDAEREEIRIRTARVWEEMLGNAEQAIVAWNVVLQDNPANVQALRALDRLYMQRGEHRELADNLQRQLNLVADEPAETVALLGRLGALREQYLGQPGGAVDSYAKILQIQPEHSETIAALERIFPNPEHELDVALLLEPIYKGRGDWPQLIAVYEVEARHAVDPEQKIALYKQIAEGYEVGLDDPARAYEALARALAEEPQNPDVQASVERLARALRKLDDLTARYGRLVASVADPERKNALYHKIARLAELELGDDAQAAAAYVAALDVWPRDLDAANALEQLYLRRADYPQPGEAAAAQGRDRRRHRRQEDAVFPRRAALRRGDRRPGQRGRRLPARAVGRRRRQGGARSARAPVHPPRRAGTSSRTSTPRRRSWRRRRSRRSRCCSCSGRSTTASWAIPSGRSRPTARSWTSIPRTTTRRRRSTGCISSWSAGTTCSPCSSARPSWRRRPPRWCRCASASASCGAST